MLAYHKSRPAVSRDGGRSSGRQGVSPPRQCCDRAIRMHLRVRRLPQKDPKLPIRRLLSASYVVRSLTCQRSPVMSRSVV